MITQVSILVCAVVMAAVSATLMIYTPSNSLTELVFAQGTGTTKFAFNLTGAEQIPPVQTNATGLAEISAYSIASDSIAYNVNSTNINDVTAGHVHYGSPGENGPVVFTMFTFDSPQNGILETGTITADKLEGPLKDKKVLDLGNGGC